MLQLESRGLITSGFFINWKPDIDAISLFEGGYTDSCKQVFARQGELEIY